MPHDRNGLRLEVGDQVTLRAEIRELYEGEGACNVELVVLHSNSTLARGEVQPTLVTNAGFCERVIEGAVVPSGSDLEALEREELAALPEASDSDAAREAAEVQAGSAEAFDAAAEAYEAEVREL